MEFATLVISYSTPVDMVDDEHGLVYRSGEIVSAVAFRGFTRYGYFYGRQISQEKDSLPEFIQVELSICHELDSDDAYIYLLNIPDPNADFRNWETVKIIPGYEYTQLTSLFVEN